MANITKEQAIKIAQDFIYKDGTVPTNLISIDANLYTERGVWAVGFEYDDDIDPGICFVDVDIYSGEPRHFYNM